MPLRLSPPGTDLLAARRPFQRLLAEAAGVLGGRVELESAYGHLGRYIAPDGSSRMIFGNALGLNPDASAQLAADKDYTARLLSCVGLPTVAGHLLFSPGYVGRMRLKNTAVASTLAGPSDAPTLAAELGYPLIVKPNSGSEGRGITRVDTAEALPAALQVAFESDDRVRIETHCEGRDHRLTVLDGTVVAAYGRIPLSIVGDGETAANQLIAERLTGLADAHRGGKVALDDPRIDQSLARQELNRDSVPADGTRVTLIDNANLSTGGTLVDLTGTLPEGATTLALRAAELLGLTCAGVDIIAPDLGKSADGATILEVNSAPGLDYYASAGPAQWERARDIVIQMLDR